MRGFAVAIFIPYNIKSEVFKVYFANMTFE